MSQSSNAIPPLMGDGKGGYRIQIVGNSGAGKSTLSARLSTLLNIPHLPLDTLFWQPGWQQTPSDAFKTRVRERMDEAVRERGGWIVDGNFTSKLGEMVRQEATDVIWLDPPLALYLPRLLWRTLLRLFRLEPPCSPGCQEVITDTLSKDGIVWWCLTNHAVVRGREAAWMERIGILDGEGLGAGASVNLEGSDIGVDEDVVWVRKQRRLGGWGNELNAWLDSVEVMVKAK